MGSKLYVGGLPYSATQDELTDLFAAHGTVQSANIISDKLFSAHDALLGPFFVNSIDICFRTGCGVCRQILPHRHQIRHVLLHHHRCVGLVV